MKVKVLCICMSLYLRKTLLLTNKVEIIMKEAVVGNVSLLQMDAIRKLRCIFLVFCRAFMILSILKHFIGLISQPKDCTYMRIIHNWTTVDRFSVMRPKSFRGIVWSLWQA